MRQCVAGIAVGPTPEPAKALDGSPPRLASQPPVRIRGDLVEIVQRLQDRIDRYRSLASWGAAQGRRCLDGAGIRGPRRENRALLVQGQVRVGEHVARMREGARGVQQVIKFRGIGPWAGKVELFITTSST